MKNYILLIISLLTLLGCENQRGQEKNTNGRVEPNNVMQEIDTFKIETPKNSYNNYHVTYLYKNRYLYAVNLFAPLQMDIIDLKEQKYIGQLQIDPNIIKTSQIANFYIQSPDSIFFLADPVPSIYLINHKGSVINKWTSSELDIPYSMDSILNTQGFGFATCSYMEGPVYDAKTNLIHVKLSPISSIDEIGDIQVKRHGFYNLKSREWKSVFGSYNGVLKDKKEARYYFDMQHTYQIIHRNSIFITYPVDHSIYRYDANTKQLVESIKVSIPLSEQFPSPLHGRDALNYSKLQALRNSSPYYGPLYYHRNIKKFSRFLNHSNKKHRSILVFDENLTLIGLKTFEFSKVSTLIPNDEGFYAIRTDEPSILDPDHIFFLKINLL